MSQALVDQPAGFMGCSQLQDFISLSGVATLGWWKPRKGMGVQVPVVPWSPGAVLDNFQPLHVPEGMGWEWGCS